MDKPCTAFEMNDEKEAFAHINGAMIIFL